MADEVLTEKRGRVLLITLNRPDARNAINTAVGMGLASAMQQLDEDDGLTAAVLTGAGPGFCSGMDLKAFLTEGPPKGFNEFLVDGAKKPLIAAVEGFALAGGLEVALTCDLMVAAKGVRIGIPEVGVGLFAAGAGLFRLPLRVGYAKAMEMAVTGEPITAQEAADRGLVSRVTAAGGALDEAIALAERIARNAPLAVAASKALIRATQGATEEELWALQQPFLKTVWGSQDAKEGPRAFAEKRAPEWTGT